MPFVYRLHYSLALGEVGSRGLGLPYRVFVCLMGLAVAALSVTGAWIWWLKRAKRIGRRSQQLARTAAREGLTSVL